VRLAIYTDYAYGRVGDALFAERAFALFLVRLSELLEGVVLLGRLDSGAERLHYRLPASVEFVALPHHSGLVTRPRETGWALARSLGRLWGVLPRVDAVWLLGPHPLLPPFAALAAARRRRVAIGVRQDFPRYVRGRHPGRPAAWLAADALEATTLAMSRRCPTVVVGPHLARRYRHARRLLPIAVSLVPEREIVPLEQALRRPYAGELRVLSVGRLESEKNPLLLADVLACLAGRARPWRLTVCGEGPLRVAVGERAEMLGVAHRVELAGYVPLGPALMARYRTSHALLHVSWTEGVPQVLYEAFAAGLPVVATAVGGVAEATNGAALLIPPGDPEAAAAALDRVAVDPGLRARLIERGLAVARAHTLEAESARVATFLTAELSSRAVRQ
jgi:glycosyltransferase involved in cell wall biosynthesis